MNEDANAKLIRELKQEISRLRDLLKAEGIEVAEGDSSVSNTDSIVFSARPIGGQSKKANKGWERH